MSLDPSPSVGALVGRDLGAKNDWGTSIRIWCRRDGRGTDGAVRSGDSIGIGRNKGVIEDHFDKQFELETTLRSRGKTMELRILETDLLAAGRTSFTRQQEPLGLGHAVLCARHIVGDEPFALLLPDMVMQSRPGCLRQMMDVYAERGGNIIASEEVPWETVHRYGVLKPGQTWGKTYEISQMVEKPPRDKAPSNIIISGRYILQPEIFAEISRQTPGAGGEIQLTDAMIRLMAYQPFFGMHFKGMSFDCGDKVGFLAANVAMALERPEIAPAFLGALIQVLRQNRLPEVEKLLAELSPK